MEFIFEVIKTSQKDDDCQISVAIKPIDLCTLDRHIVCPEKAEHVVAVLVGKW